MNVTSPSSSGLRMALAVAFGIAWAGGLLLPQGCSNSSATTDSPSPSITIPSALSAIESRAEDAFDHALASNLDAIRADATAIASGWAGYRERAKADGADDATLTAMDQAVRDFGNDAATVTDGVALARAANAVSAPMDELYTIYHPSTPAAVLALDYLGREIVLDARQSRFADASAHTDAVQTTFGSLRADLVAAGGAEVTTNYEASIAAVRAASTAEDAVQIEKEARDGLEIVDAMEGVFESAHKP